MGGGGKGGIDTNRFVSTYAKHSLASYRQEKLTQQMEYFLPRSSLKEDPQSRRETSATSVASLTQMRLLRNTVCNDHDGNGISGTSSASWNAFVPQLQ